MINEFYKKIVRWPIGCLLFFIYSCGMIPEEEVSAHTSVIIEQENEKTDRAFTSIREAKATVLTGDLIMRTGNDFTSDVMKKLSVHDKTYSHCGIASLENDTLFVYHAIGGDWNPDQKIRKDPFELFCNPFDNKGFGIYRYQLNQENLDRFVNTARKYYVQEVTFDMRFDLATDDQIYCTEYIFKSMKDMLPIGTTTTHGVTYIAPDNLYQLTECQVIQQIKYE